MKSPSSILLFNLFSTKFNCNDDIIIVLLSFFCIYGINGILPLLVFIVELISLGYTLYLFKLNLVINPSPSLLTIPLKPGFSNNVKFPCLSILTLIKLFFCEYISNSFKLILLYIHFL